MYIYRTNRLKMNQLNKKRWAFGYKPCYSRKGDFNWTVANYEELHKDDYIDELNKALGVEIPDIDEDEFEKIYNEIINSKKDF